MHQLIAEIGFLVLGLVLLATGKNTATRIAGVIYLLPLPFTFLIMVPLATAAKQSNPYANGMAYAFIDYGFMFACMFIGGKFAAHDQPAAQNKTQAMPYESRDWISTKDGQPFPARFVRSEEDGIIVRRDSDNKYVKLPAEKLSPADAAYVQSLSSKDQPADAEAERQQLLQNAEQERKRAIKATLSPAERMCENCGTKYKPRDYNQDSAEWFCSACKHTLVKE